MICDDYCHYFFYFLLLETQAAGPEQILSYGPDINEKITQEEEIYALLGFFFRVKYLFEMVVMGIYRSLKYVKNTCNNYLFLNSECVPQL